MMILVQCTPSKEIGKTQGQVAARDYRQGALRASLPEHQQSHRPGSASIAIRNSEAQKKVGEF